MKVIARLIKLLLVETPLYPHWLDFRNLYRANEVLYTKMHGDVLETGAGNGEVKEHILTYFKKQISSYVATDYSSWDPLFETQTKKMTALGSLSRILYGKAKDKEKLDAVCSALDLPYKAGTFDTYASFEVLEHIDDPERFFSEASRVLKKGGTMLVSVPFMYREHSEGTGFDYHRFTVSALTNLCKRNNLKVTQIFTNSYFGTAMAAFTNQYVIRKIAEGAIPIKIVFFIASPFVFIFTNIVGFVIDSLDHDVRFASHYHLIATKQ